MLNQKGGVPILVLVAVIGVLGFLLISNLFSFKDNIFQRLFPKPASQASEPDIPTTQSNYKLGVKFFPGLTNLNFQQGWALASEVADMAYISRGWNDVDNPEVSLRTDIQTARSQGLEIYLSFDPLCTDRTRVSSTHAETSELSCQPNFPMPIKFETQDVEPNYIAKLRELASLNPKYMLIGLEVNTYKSVQPEDYYYFARNIYPEAYVAIKQINPDIQVAVSFIYDDGRLAPHGSDAALTEFVQDFTSANARLDYLGISIYPWPWTGVNSYDSNQVPNDLFIKMSNASGGLPIFITETGMISHPVPFGGVTLAGSPENQAAWIQSLKVNS